MRFDHEERSRGWALAGVVVGILGVALLFGLDLSTEWAAVMGGLMVLLASFGYAAGALLMKAPARRLVRRSAWPRRPWASARC